MKKHKINKKPLILLISSNKKEIEEMKSILTIDYELLIFETAQEAIENFDLFFLQCNVVFISTQISDMAAIQLLKTLKEISVLPEYILISDIDEIDQAVESTKQGAFDYLTTPLSRDIIEHTILKARSHHHQVEKLKEITTKKFLNQFELDFQLSLVNDKVKHKRLHGEVVSIHDLVEAFQDNQLTQPDVFKRVIAEFKEELQSAYDINGIKTVLVVEDDELFSEDLQDILEPYFKIHLANSGAQAKDICAANPDIDLVLLDVYLPDTSGIDLIGFFKAYREDIGIIVMTGYQETQIAVQSLRDGAHDYINKPFYKNTILTRISNVLQQQYFKNILPILQKTMPQDDMTYKTKLDILNEICKNKEENTVTMKEIYDLFPEIEECHIPNQITVPQGVFDEGAMSFIEELRDRAEAKKEAKPTSRVSLENEAQR